MNETKTKGLLHHWIFDWAGMLWRNISVSKKLYIVVGTMALLVIIELLTLRFAMTNLSAVRAFVGGEGSWSKGQKNALYLFQRYALTNNEKDYLAIQETLKIPEGDRQARIELQKDDPNMELVHAGFLAGKIHPDDHEATINLLRRFYWVSFITSAIESWTKGDELLVKFKDAADEYHHLVTSGEKNSLRAKEILETIDDLNDQLSAEEAKFSTVLGEGSRWLERVVFMSLFFIVITVESIGLSLTFITSRMISRGLNDLNRVAEEFSVGNFNRQLTVTSKDEIGTLTSSINKMGNMLKKSYSELRDSHFELEKKVIKRTAELASTSDENVKLYNKAKEALTIRDEFLSIANHELRTPLTALTLQLHSLERSINAKDDEIKLEHVRDIVKKSNRLVKKLSTLQDLLMDLTQIQFGKLELKLEKADLVVIAQDCVSQLTLEANRAGSKIVVDAPAALYGQFDVVRVGQVITNLLSNAIKYGEGKAIQLILKNENEKAVIIVKDNGPGIPQENQEKIFERFERASLDHSLSGMGLGLYISKQIVEAFDGTLTVQSKVGEGASFKVEFPLS